MAIRKRVATVVLFKTRPVSPVYASGTAATRSYTTTAPVAFYSTTTTTTTTTPTTPTSPPTQDDFVDDDPTDGDDDITTLHGRPAFHHSTRRRTTAKWTGLTANGGGMRRGSGTTTFVIPPATTNKSAQRTIFTYADHPLPGDKYDRKEAAKNHPWKEPPELVLEDQEEKKKEKKVKPGVTGRAAVEKGLITETDLAAAEMYDLGYKVDAADYPENWGGINFRPDVLEPGDIFKRHGKCHGSYLARVGEPFDRLGLHASDARKEVHVLRVLKKIPAHESDITPALKLKARGGGKQYLPAGGTIQDYIDNGRLEDITDEYEPPTPADDRED